ncbi:hypothetical protein BGC07_12685 [Piscirickettsia litoralis]|uniref:Lipoprotein n=2 Tax=Piscirickettsia litoralis TaxID=1891921 RepID=A0ABX3A9I4_9GAMM|nr:hypothetical protein BGC07_12685 [Piscirickettsia litoralis]
MIKKTSLLLISLILTACAGAPSNPQQADQCEEGLKQAYKELDYAKTKGLDGTVDYTKAASLLSAAKIQQQFNKFPNCINKVERARYYIKQSQK